MRWRGAASGLIESGFRRGDVLVSTNATKASNIPCWSTRWRWWAGSSRRRRRSSRSPSCRPSCARWAAARKEDGVAPQLFFIRGAVDVGGGRGGGRRGRRAGGAPRARRRLRRRRGRARRRRRPRSCSTRAIEDAPEGARAVPARLVARGAQRKGRSAGGYGDPTFSSGTTGPPKGVHADAPQHGRESAAVRRPRAVPGRHLRRHPADVRGEHLRHVGLLIVRAAPRRHRRAAAAI